MATTLVSITPTVKHRRYSFDCRLMIGRRHATVNVTAVELFDPGSFARVVDERTGHLLNWRKQFPIDRRHDSYADLCFFWHRVIQQHLNAAVAHIRKPRR